MGDGSDVVRPRRVLTLAGLLCLGLGLVLPALWAASAVGLTQRLPTLNYDASHPVTRVHVWGARASLVTVQVDRSRGVPYVSVTRACLFPPRSRGPLVDLAEGDDVLYVDSAPLYGLERQLTRCDTRVFVSVPAGAAVFVDMGDRHTFTLDPGAEQLVIEGTTHTEWPAALEATLPGVR